MLLWSVADDLLRVTASTPIGHVTIASLAIVSVDTTKPPSAFAIRFPAGITQSVFRQLLFYGNGGIAQHTVTLIPGALDLGCVLYLFIFKIENTVLPYFN